MKKLLLAFIGSLSVLSHASAQKAKYVVLVTIDGFRPDFYLDQQWPAVNLQQLKSKGVSALGVDPIFPSVTYPNHTTIITGVHAAKHGVYYNDLFAPESDGKVRWYWNYDSIKVPTVFDAVKKGGGHTAAVIWPVCVGAKSIDYNVPDVWDVDGGSDRRAATAATAKPAGLFEELEQNATGKLTAQDFNMDKDYLSMDDDLAKMAGYIIRKHKPEFIAVHLPVADHMQHIEGRDGPVVRRAVASADHAIGVLLEAIDKAGIKDSTAILITGDHGFVTINTAFSPNVLLKKAGLLDDAKTGKWKAMFHAGGGGAFLRLKDPNDKATLDKVNYILNALPEDQRKMFRILNKAALEAAGADPNAALALAATPGITIRGAVTGEVTKATKGGTHGYFPDFKEIQTGFVAYGAGISKSDKLIEQMSLTDIAPIIVKLLGLELKGMEGKVPAGLLID
ncbi:MAG: ectonucleotide pyrophosphatase/phosphodiesterase [Taibaiella sp.]|jgi:predicted AlkP superfamily pyrophosphatase or phosphodiesterase